MIIFFTGILSQCKTPNILLLNLVQSIWAQLLRENILHVPSFGRRYCVCKVVIILETIHRVRTWPLLRMADA